MCRKKIPITFSQGCTLLLSSVISVSTLKIPQNIANFPRLSKFWKTVRTTRPLSWGKSRDIYSDTVISIVPWNLIWYFCGNLQQLYDVYAGTVHLSKINVAPQFTRIRLYLIMKSSNGNISHVTVPGVRRMHPSPVVSPHTLRDSNADIWCFFVANLNKLLNKHSIDQYFGTPWRSFDVAAMLPQHKAYYIYIYNKIWPVILYIFIIYLPLLSWRLNIIYQEVSTWCSEHVITHRTHMEWGLWCQGQLP